MDSKARATKALPNRMVRVLTSRFRSGSLGFTGFSRLFGSATTAGTGVVMAVVATRSDAAAYFVGSAAAGLTTMSLLRGMATALIPQLAGGPDPRERRVIWIRLVAMGLASSAAAAGIVGFLDADRSGFSIAWALNAFGITIIRAGEIISTETARAAGVIGRSDKWFIVSACLLTVSTAGPRIIDLPRPWIAGAALALGSFIILIRAAYHAILLRPSSDGHEPTPNTRVVSVLLRPFVVSATVAGLAGYLDVLVAPRILGNQSSVDYSLSVRFAMLLSFPVLILGIHAGPLVAEAWKRDLSATRSALAVAHHQTRRMSLLTIGVALPATTLVVLIVSRGSQSGNNLVIIPSFLVLAVAHVVNVLFGPTHAILTGLGRAEDTLHANGLALLVLLVWLAIFALTGSSSVPLYAGATLSQILVQNILAYRRLGERFGRAAAAWG